MFFTTKKKKFFSTRLLDNKTKIMSDPSGGGAMVPASGDGKKRGVPTAGKPKNKAAAQVQVTAEQILLEARDRMEVETVSLRDKMQDKEELAEYRDTKRREFEGVCQRNRTLLGAWCKYAKWESAQGEYTRARSVYERALDSIPTNHSLYQRYAEMEMKNGNINSARNIWQRSITTLPRADQLWMKWAHMEQTIGDIAMAREVFNKWMAWKPKPHGWHLFVKFEIHQNEIENARDVIRQMVTFFNDTDSWLYFTKFEEKHGTNNLTRRIYEEALDALSIDMDPKLFIHFAKFEERQKEYERARSIYRIALDRIPKEKAPELYQMYVESEKQFGERQGIEDALVARKRFEYEESLAAFPLNYDTWINYVRMEESQNNPQKVRELYERAISNIPQELEKQYWGRYMFLWIMYAMYEEVDQGDESRTREIYHKCLSIIPHKHFSFSKIWIALAQFEIRHNNIDTAREVYGKAIGNNPRPKIFRSYIDLEMRLGQIKRVRNIYNSWLKSIPNGASTWMKLADLEIKLNEVVRVRSILELALKQELDEPEPLWKKYILFEIKQKCYDNARSLYRRLSDLSKHVQVYLAWAQLEEKTINDIDSCRRVYENAHADLSAEASKEEISILLEAWKDFETSHGNPQQLESVLAKINPDRVKKKTGKMLAMIKNLKRQKTENEVCK